MIACMFSTGEALRSMTRLDMVACTCGPGTQEVQARVEVQGSPQFQSELEAILCYGETLERRWGQVGGQRKR